MLGDNQAGLLWLMTGVVWMFDSHVQVDRSVDYVFKLKNKTTPINPHGGTCAWEMRIQDVQRSTAQMP